MDDCFCPCWEESSTEDAVLRMEIPAVITYETEEARGRPHNYDSLSQDLQAEVDSGGLDLESITARARMGPLEGTAWRVIVANEGFGETEEEAKATLKQAALDAVASQLRLLTGPGPKSEGERRDLDEIGFAIGRHLKVQPAADGDAEPAAAPAAEPPTAPVVGGGDGQAGADREGIRSRFNWNYVDVGDGWGPTSGAIQFPLEADVAIRWEEPTGQERSQSAEERQESARAGWRRKKTCVVEVRRGRVVGTARERGFDTIEEVHRLLSDFEMKVVARAVADMQAKIDARLDTV